MRMREENRELNVIKKRIEEKAEEWEVKSHGCWPSLTP
jgi:hypothetical protein